ncbi:Non-lysosomal glucosylceramidase [Trichinella pseudospiralis]
MLSIILKLLIIAFINFQLCTCSSDTDKVEVEEMVFSVPLFKPQNVPQIKEKKLKKLLEPLGKLYKTPSDVGTPISSSEASESYHKLKTVHQAEKCDSTTNVYTITLQKTDCKAEQIIKGSPSTNCSNVEDSHPISCTILSKVTSENETIIGAFCHVNMQKKLAKKKSICELFRYPGEEKFKTFVPKEVHLCLLMQLYIYHKDNGRSQMKNITKITVDVKVLLVVECYRI